MASGIQILEVPPGYPAYLPKPVLRDGGLYLDPYPAMPDKTTSSISPEDYAWVMVALQPYVLAYSPKPYDVNWVIDGWGSGKVHIAQALTGRFGGVIRLSKPLPQENFLEHPKEPNGFDRFLISLNRVLPDVMGKLFDSFIPGTGMLVRTAVGKETGAWDPLKQPVDLSPALQEIQQGGDGGVMQKVGSNWPVIAGGVLLLIGLYYLYDGDS